MNIVNKTGIGLSSIGGIVGLGFVMHEQLWNNAMSRKLKADGYQILENSSNEWTSILNSYHKTINSNADLKFDNFNGESVEKLKENCRLALKKDLSDEKNYKKITKWCVVPKTISEWLPKGKYSKLNTTQNNDNLDQNEWNAKIDSHNSEDTNQDGKFPYLADVRGGVEKSKEGRNLIKQHCKELESKKHHEPSFDSDLKKAKLWCYMEK